MVLLVEIPQGDGVREKLVQVLHALAAGRFAEGDRHLDQVVEGLDLVAFQVLLGGGLDEDLVCVEGLGHGSSPRYWGERKTLLASRMGCNGADIGSVTGPGRRSASSRPPVPSRRGWCPTRERAHQHEDGRA